LLTFRGVGYFSVLGCASDFYALFVDSKLRVRIFGDLSCALLCMCVAIAKTQGFLLRVFLVSCRSCAIYNGRRSFVWLSWLCHIRNSISILYCYCALSVDCKFSIVYTRVYV
jgi:hypothetical protein